MSLSFLLILFFPIMYMMIRYWYIEYLTHCLLNMINHYTVLQKNNAVNFELINKMRVHFYIYSWKWRMESFINVSKDETEFWKLFYIIKFRYYTRPRETPSPESSEPESSGQAE